MDALNIAASLIGIADVAGKTIHKLHNLNSLWNSAPEEVTRLMNTLDSLRRLLDSLRAPLAAGQLVGPGQTPPGDLFAELATAEETLGQLESILASIHGEQGTIAAPPATISHPSAKARWAMHRKTLLGLHSRLHDHLQRIMTRLQLMNMYVKYLPTLILHKSNIIRGILTNYETGLLLYRSVTTQIHAGLSQQYMNVRTMEDRLVQDLQQSRGQIMNRISHSVDDLTNTVGRVED